LLKDNLFQSFQTSDKAIFIDVYQLIFKRFIFSESDTQFLTIYKTALKNTNVSN